MHAHSCVRLLLCLLIVGAHSHCVMSHGAELVSEVEAARRAEPPFGETKTCENESGCICKGALVPEAVPAFFDHDHLTHWLPSTHWRVDSCGIVVLNWDLDLIPDAPPPLAGASARIVLQSFQI